MLNFKSWRFLLKNCTHLNLMLALFVSRKADISQIQLEDYNCIAQGKSSRAKGGLIMYIHTKYDYKLIKVNQCENWEGQLIEITAGGLTHPVIMGNIYRPPRDLNVNYKQFIDEFSLLLSTFDQNNSKVIVAGEFNINLLKINQKEIFSVFFYSLTEHSLFPKNNTANKIFKLKWCFNR